MRNFKLLIFTNSEGITEVIFSKLILISLGLKQERDEDNSSKISSKIKTEWSESIFILSFPKCLGVSL
jgi:hypothetical protein